MNVLVVSSFGVIKDIFRSVLKQQSFIQDVRLINPSEIKSADVRIGHKFDNNLDLIIYDLDTTCYCSDRKIRAIEEAMNLSAKRGNNSKILFVASEAQLATTQEKVSFIDDYLIIKPFRIKDVIHKLKDINSQSLLINTL
ncbi:hypothetical protein [Aeromonas sp. R9-2]|uniref:hypothetical protein n=1 Tax=Aeromonas sp. R9-2 TaxID=3138479 RepID=UPI0034A41480